MHSVTNTIHPPQITQQSGVAVSHTCSGQPGCLQAAAGIDGFGSRASGSCPLHVQEMCTANVTLGCLSSAFLQTLGAHEISAPTQSWSICASCQHRGGWRWLSPSSDFHTGHISPSPLYDHTLSWPLKQLSTNSLWGGHNFNLMFFGSLCTLLYCCSWRDGQLCLKNLEMLQLRPIAGL